MIVSLGCYCLIPLSGLVSYMVVQCRDLICFLPLAIWSLLVLASLVPFIIVLALLAGNWLALLQGGLCAEWQGPPLGSYC